jgi:hypothetical protein
MLARKRLVPGERAAPITVDRRALAKTYILLVKALAAALLLTTEQHDDRKRS